MNINDPIHGFIDIPKGILMNLIEKPCFQRLRSISQMGLSRLVYPGANHSRFEHSLGCLYLMQKATDVLKNKEIKISKEEEIGLFIAILFHDIGHGPFSHALERQILNVSHEEVSKAIIYGLNKKFDGRLTLALEILKETYPKKFLSQLISSQIDMDRMDYLQRDSFYSGVREGNINSYRIISMFNVVEGHLVLESKSLHSIESFLIARSFMYWQVYLHKTSLSAEMMLVSIIKRAKELISRRVTIEASKPLLFLLKNKTKNLSSISEEELENFISLDDCDIWQALKSWQNHTDKILSRLSKMLLNRNLFSVEIFDEPINPQKIEEKKKEVMNLFSISFEETAYFIYEKKLKNSIYSLGKKPIQFLKKNGQILNLLDAFPIFLNSMNSTQITNKYYFCYVKEKISF